MPVLALLMQLDGLTTDDLPSSPLTEDTFSGIGALLWMLFLIIVIIVAAYYFTRVMGKRMGGGVAGGVGVMRVVDRLAVAQNKSILMVRVGQRCFMIGVTGTQLTLLGELESDELPDTPAQAAPVPDRVASFLVNLVKQRGKNSANSTFAEQYRRSAEEYTLDCEADDKDGNDR